jgi:hypothetical protein
MSNSKVFGVTKSKILGGLAAVVVLGIGMDYVIPLLGPLDYLGISPPQMLFGIPFFLGGLAYFLATWRVRAEQDRRKRRIGYAIRLLFFCLLCAIGFYVPSAYRERHVEFIPVSDRLDEGAQTSGIEQALGFKVGVQLNSKGKSLFFKREPGASQKVRDWLREHGAQASTH